MTGSGRPGPENSPYRGVGRKSYGNWSAKIQRSGKQIWLGTYHNERMAAVAFDVFDYYFRKHPSRLNFPTLVNRHPPFPPGCTHEQIATAIKEAANRLFSISCSVSPVAGRLLPAQMISELDMVENLSTKDYWGWMLQSTNDNDWMSSWLQLTLEFTRAAAHFGPANNSSKNPMMMQMVESFLMEDPPAGAAEGNGTSSSGVNLQAAADAPVPGLSPHYT